MPNYASGGREAVRNPNIFTKLMTGAGLAALALPASAMAQDSATEGATETEGEAIIVTGIRSSLASALNEQRNADSLVEGIQFLNQEQENALFETINIAGTLEWAPNENIKLYFDGIYNDQTRRQESTRVQGSGVSAGGGQDEIADGDRLLGDLTQDFSGSFSVDGETHAIYGQLNFESVICAVMSA